MDEQVVVVAVVVLVVETPKIVEEHPYALEVAVEHFTVF